MTDRKVVANPNRGHMVEHVRAAARDRMANALEDRHDDRVLRRVKSTKPKALGYQVRVSPMRDRNQPWCDVRVWIGPYEEIKQAWHALATLPDGSEWSANINFDSEAELLKELAHFALKYPHRWRVKA